ncbi:EamA family transporter RarD [Sphingobium sp. HBC34]|uniref:EamA family transporter RarD n=1 Tax=Sphingobium cyanobacteriorum TaxID=3063954 RepID=A0ABT8ZK24_9SPHN|nr:EamA family transporter RarD [Sphingobium sp. HBC34]MDO7834488.1 EamA family transporter RarD [Sphingobium sp. HBC34]
MAGLAAYGLWGLLPLFFRLLHHVDPVEIVTQRILWSLLLILSLLALRRGLPAFFLVLRDRRLVLALTISALMIGLNWLTYVWAVNQGHVLAASLGYFLNPLVNVTLGVLVLKERLRRPQLLAIGIAAIGVAILAASALTTLWISLTLAISFAFYALVRKLTPVAPMAGLGVETALLAPLAVGYLVWEAQHGGIGFGQDMATTSLLILAGAVTTVPLLLFAVAAQRLPMAMLGLLQYITPMLQFFCGVLLFGEKLGLGQMLSFGLIWVGLILFASDGIAVARRNRLATA